MFNFLPNNKILDWSKLKAFADDKINVNQKLNFVLGRVENIVGNGEIAHYKQFLLFPSVFERLLLQTCKNQGLFEKGLNMMAKGNFSKYL